MKRGFFINGAWHTPDDCDIYTVAEPATGKPVGEVCLADERTVDQAVEAAELFPELEKP